MSTAERHELLRVLRSEPELRDVLRALVSRRRYPVGAPTAGGRRMDADRPRSRPPRSGAGVTSLDGNPLFADVTRSARSCRLAWKSRRRVERERELSELTSAIRAVVDKLRYTASSGAGWTPLTPADAHALLLALSRLHRSPPARRAAAAPPGGF